ncbi:MAG: copper amine oxidase N-terminal domain-containing protein [Firmicutes bacterium]|nr:copper amine oxidase N-terminal domain-containing protein [Bacillota bacterium]
MKGEKYLIVVTVLLAVVLVLVSVSYAASYGVYKKIDVLYNNIKIIVNGKTAASDPEPFIYNGTTFVPVRLIGEALGMDVQWDRARNAVVIQGHKGQEAASDYELESLRVKLYYKDLEIQQLKEEIEELKSKKDIAKELEDYLEDEYSRWNKMDFYFDVYGDEDEIELTIEIDLDEDGDRWWDTDEDDIEDWLEDIYEYVEDEYGDIDFYGTIVDTADDEILVEFDVHKGKLRVDF